MEAPLRAVWYERTGPAEDVLTAGEQPTPRAGPGQVRVRLAASGVNPADCSRRAGTGNSVMEAPLIIPNSDGAGVVDEIGEGVAADCLGRRVWLYNGQRGGRALGTAAEWIALDVGLVTALPDEVSFTAGACLGIPCMTAHCAVFAGGPVAGKTVLVTGGGGAVGNYAVQLAAWAGARVIATASGDKVSDALSAGAEVVLDHRTQDIRGCIVARTAGKGVDHVVEVDFGGNLSGLPDIVANNGTVAAYASRGDQHPRFPFYELMRKNVGIRLILLNNLDPAMRRRAQADITRWLHGGPRFHRVVGPFELTATARAHRTVEAGGKRGTVVVTI
jgi:NADPH2:quinone reductase